MRVGQSAGGGSRAAFKFIGKTKHSVVFSSLFHWFPSDKYVYSRIIVVYNFIVQYSIYSL